jgi:hypothetical protein
MGHMRIVTSLALLWKEGKILLFYLIHGNLGILKGGSQADAWFFALWKKQNKKMKVEATENPIILALDLPTAEAMSLVKELKDVVGGFNVGNGLLIKARDRIAGIFGPAMPRHSLRSIPDS